MENREQTLLNFAVQLGYLTPEQIESIKRQQGTLDGSARHYGLSPLHLRRLQLLYLQWLLLFAAGSSGILDRQLSQRLLREKITLLRQGQDDGGMQSLITLGLTPEFITNVLPQLVERRLISQQEAGWLGQAVRQCSQSDVTNCDPGMAPTKMHPIPAPAETDSNFTSPGERKGVKPKMLGPYQIFEEIGAGGMGKVYKGYHPQLQKTVAIKVMLRSSESSTRERERFLAEARLSAQLRHPNIVSVYDVGTAEGTDYLVMDYIAGHSLAQQLQKKRMSPRQAAELLTQVAGAMHSAHQQGIVHRDLKPANLMIDQESGRPLVMDFGLAKNINLSSELTKSGDLLGTPRYMAPEQASGELGAISPQTDIYALGAILYEMLTSKPATPGDTPFNIIFNVLQKDVIPPRQHCPNLARDMETICLKALAKEPRHRYQSAAELAQDLRRFLDGEMVLARRSSLSYRAWKTIKRHRLLATTLLLIVLAIGGASWWSGYSNRQQKWHDWWQNFANHLKSDYQIIQTTDLLQNQGQRLLLNLQQQRKQRIWVSDLKINHNDDKLFRCWQKYRQRLEDCYNITTKYLYWPEIAANQPGLLSAAIHLLAPGLRKFYRLKPTDAPGIQVIQRYLEKIGSLYQQADQAYDRYRKAVGANGLSEKPEQLQLAQQLLQYAAALSRCHWPDSVKSLNANAKAKEYQEKLKQHADRIKKLEMKIDNIIESTHRLVRNHLINFQFNSDDFDLDRILVLLQQICRLDSTNAFAYFQIGRIFHNVGKLEHAALFYRKSHERQPNLLPLYYLSEIYYRQWQKHLQEYQPDAAELDAKKQQFTQVQRKLEKLQLEKAESSLLMPYQHINAFYQKAINHQCTILQGYKRHRSGAGYLNFALCPVHSNYRHQIDPDAYRRGLYLYQNLLSDLQNIHNDHLQAKIAYFKGQIYFDLGLMEVPVKQGISYLSLALRHYRLAVAGQRFDVNLRRKMGYAYFAIGDFAKAEDVYRQLFYLFLPSKAQYGYRFFNRRDHYFYILCLLNQKKWQKATVELEKHLQFWRQWKKQNRPDPQEKDMHDPSIYRKLGLLAALYLMNGHHQALAKVLPELKSEIVGKKITSGEIGLIYVVGQLKLNDPDEALRMLKSIWKELTAASWSQAAGKGLALSKMLATQARSLRFYGDLFAAPPHVRQQLRLLDRLLQKYTSKDKWGANYYNINMVPLLQRLVDFIEKQPQLQGQLQHLTRKVAGQPVPLTLMLHLFSKLAIDISEQRLLHLDEIESISLAYQKAVALYRRGKYAQALRWIEFALNRQPAESLYHYSAAILCGHLAKNQNSMKSKACYHLQQALMLGWSADYLSTEPAFRAICSHPYFLKLQRQHVPSMAGYSAESASEKARQIAKRLGPISAMQWWRTWQQANYRADNFANIQRLEEKTAAALLVQAKEVLSDRPRLEVICDCIHHLLSPRQQLNCNRQLAKWLWRRASKLGDKDITQAEDDFTQAIALYPECWQAYAQRARIREHHGQQTKAKKDHEMAAKINPDYRKTPPGPEQTTKWHK